MTDKKITDGLNEAIETDEDPPYRIATAFGYYVHERTLNEAIEGDVGDSVGEIISHFRRLAADGNHTELNERLFTEAADTLLSQQREIERLRQESKDA